MGAEPKPVAFDDTIQGARMDEAIRRWPAGPEKRRLARALELFPSYRESAEKSVADLIATGSTEAIAHRAAWVHISFKEKLGW